MAFLPNAQNQKVDTTGFSKNLSGGDKNTQKAFETLDQVLGLPSASQGSVLIRGASDWLVLEAGVSGTFLKTNGEASNAEWSTPAGGGNVLCNDTTIENRIPLWNSSDKTLKLGLELSTDLGVTGSDAKIPSENAVVSALGQKLPLPTGEPTTGDAIVYSGSSWILLSAGDNGKYLMANGAGSLPSWEAVAGSGLGDVSGPSSSAVGAIPAFGATTGKLLGAGYGFVLGSGGEGSDTNVLSEKKVYDVFVKKPSGAVWGSVLFRGETDWESLSPATPTTAGMFLGTNGSDAAPSWQVMTRVIGPSTTTVGNVPTWNGTDGQSLGVGLPVQNELSFDVREESLVLEDGIRDAHNKQALRTLVNSDASVVALDGTLLFECGAAQRSCFLPLAEQYPWRIFTVKKTDAGVGAVRIVCNGTEEIEGENIVYLTSQWEALTIQCDGTKWVKLGSGSSGGGSTKKPTVVKTDNYAVQTVDTGLTLVMDSASAKTFTLPSVGESDIGVYFTFVKRGAGALRVQTSDLDVVIDSGAGSYIENVDASQIYAVLTLQLVSETLWVSTGMFGTWTTYE